MKKIYYAAGAAVLALSGFGIYETSAQTTNPDNSGGVLIIEEDDYAVQPSQGAAARVRDNLNNSGRTGHMPDNSTTGVHDAKVKSDVQNNNVPASDFQALPGDPGVEAAPVNQPTVDKAMKNQNPNYNNGAYVVEEVTETVD